ncbi:aspartyl/glutamyl-tRNA amidotransferase subunit B [Gluconobacter thailandicus F149-1 = NBRC 100600]|uniref:Aspartyl/glutamyl-tRNA(Asn/Gln) amidotransferase subunit B n=1 Tax=Gluconobacter thailandicus NBRC 3257 TaxID=1381097 RepID=A0ABQ0J0H2_GLUTH|nr:Asp-tRNA(Asn)/Glu-tRNA(Gln) amidotransferase subunit GatB [Gluconobacter thailandicus]AFW02208.1 aspartyl/glutamyl-tRNA amidotransferase subunit B [Gluconobacter oxydans H24]ANQ42261.1 aspartyl/glutamyl-tRNA amidotransferase subunit B [Gluconobacter oxydans]GAN89225.1 aspartyl/glutamyl-tRNA amidotransferase subunit B [Gluconobacter frateurii M-2]KXV52873.1 glutamyl-tRNA amidotransferase [Gluconobacter thailandicus]GAC86772.1 aspartyl/glutamyl-tRNA amidotransferase subunit B [Gluconobacter t
MSYRITGNTGEWEIVVGLEVHAQVISNAKLFSGASASYGGEPNTHVSLIDAGFPGMLPVLNRECVAQAVRTGLGLNAQINLFSRFDRKNYFYADLPTGYQISQFAHPIVGEGKVLVDLADGTTREIGVTRLHLEQDAGKSVHDQDPTRSFIDLNRAGVALMEIVSEPDIRSPEEAGAYLRKLRQILRYIGTCDGNMEEGSMRADVNVSVRKPGEEGYRTRCEIKNVNSIRYVMQSIEVEAQRQIEIWEAGGEVDQETRLFDHVRSETRSLRSKEDAHDYRYFPDPDLLPLVIEQSWVDELKAALPELPEAKRERLEQDYGVSRYEASVLTAEQAVADFYETVAKGADARLATNWMLGDFFAALNRTGRSIEDSPVSAEGLRELLALISDSTINGKIAKEVLEDMVETGESASAIVERKGLRQVTDTGAIENSIREILAANADKVAEYKSGKDKLFGFFVGQTMKAMKGKGNPALVNETLKKLLSE